MELHFVFACQGHDHNDDGVCGTPCYEPATHSLTMADGSNVILCQKHAEDFVGGAAELSKLIEHNERHKQAWLN